MTPTEIEAGDERRVAMWPCPHIEDHTPAPEGYIQWHSWAAKMSKTHKQRKCPGCNTFAIWEPRAAIARAGGE
jgi:hypothetical protein